jgi:hypothetical protein
MFRQLVEKTQLVDLQGATAGSLTADILFSYHPAYLVHIMEFFWKTINTAQSTGTTPIINLFPMPDSVDAVDELKVAPQSKSSQLSKMTREHLIYAYMIENTRIVDIFRRVLFEFFHGEKLGPPSEATQLWLRNTEALFFKDSAPFFVGSVESSIRPDVGASRRNAYYRMFGMDLNHGKEDNQPYPYFKGEPANTDFVTTIEELLREVWLGLTNFENTSGARPTDDAKINDLVDKLKLMLTSRRQDNMLNLRREEFSFIAMMSWFHLTVDPLNPIKPQIIKDLRAEADGPEQVLFSVAKRVGIPAHGLSRSFFSIAEPISNILVKIESGLFANNASLLYDLKTNPNSPDAKDMQTIINHWSTITGRNVKARPVSAT